MDHHCPWIYNCVGYRNHKYFFLLLFYSVAATWLVATTMVESVDNSIQYDTPFHVMFMLLFGETLACSLAVLVTLFFSFHVWLMMKGMTTIEFCEKSGQKPGKGGKVDFSSRYQKATYIASIQEVLGRNPLLWLIPVREPEPPNGGVIFEITNLSSVKKGWYQQFSDAGSGASQT
mmetsp:Transcript_22872/g.58540  ORF Transcript_22872/g.58540 Transcript_22872/m.58540 type:complete len:175 (-) Transcript_22872:227-751(-)